MRAYLGTLCMQDCCNTHTMPLPSPLQVLPVRSTKPLTMPEDMELHTAKRKCREAEELEKVGAAWNTAGGR